MKNTVQYILFAISTLVMAAFTSGNSEYNEAPNTLLTDSASNYSDGTYSGQSQSIYTAEPFWGHIKISIDEGMFTEIKFSIRDSILHEVVDSMYGVNHYSGTPEYMQQCVNDGHGIETYPLNLLQTQDIDEVDAITGATWSYNMFMSATREALGNAPATTSVYHMGKSELVDIQISPNPFSTSLNIEYRLPSACKVDLTIYDSQCRLVKCLISEKQTAGSYSVNWEDNSIQGIYFYNLKADGITISGKITKI
jgi:major membrane immunogen (membrane-anchored lipoprotein)